MFPDREEAGRRLASKLVSYRGKNAMVLALPRGGVVTGAQVAKELNLPLDIVVVRKIGHPTSAEYAVGAVDEAGETVFNGTEAATIEKRWLAEEIGQQKQEAKRRSVLYRGGREPMSITNKIAIIVDDGIATGLTMRLAVRIVKMQRPRKIIVAVPVAPPESLAMLREEGADEVVVVEPPETYVGAVGAHYVQFDQVEDAEVVRLLQERTQR